MDVLPKTFLQIILAAKWLVQHSKYCIAGLRNSGM